MGPGQKHVHDDFEEIWVEVMHQEKLDQTIRKLDAEIEQDERRTKAKTPPTPRPKSKPSTPPTSSRPRARNRRPSQRLRDESAGTKDDSSAEDRPPFPGASYLFAGALLLTIAGAVIAIIVRVMRSLS